MSATEVKELAYDSDDDYEEVPMPVAPDDPALPSDDYDPTYLRTLHPVPWFDKHITMERKRHVYQLDGVDLPTSTTGYMKEFVGEFDGDAAAKRILGRLATAAHEDASGIKVNRPLWLTKQLKRYAHCKTVADMKLAWTINCNKGTFAHRLIELYYNNELDGELSRHSALKTPEFQQFLRFHRQHVEAKGFVPFRTEFTMFKLDIGGQIDMLYQHKDDIGHPERRWRLWMVDWKRKFELGNHGDPLRFPFDDMPPGDRSKFTIQLNNYKGMIESLSPYRIVRMSVLMIHPELPDYQLEEIRDIQRQIAIGFDRRRVMIVQARASAAADILRTLVRSAELLKCKPTLASAQRLIDQAVAALTELPVDMSEESACETMDEDFML